MWKNYLTVALRNLRRQKGTAAINLFGLAAGIACCLLIGLFVRYELGFDRFHERADRLYRVWQEERSPEGETNATSFTPIPLAPTLAASFPEVEAAVRLDYYDELVGAERPSLTRRVLYADPAFFTAFSFPLVAGNPATALRDPHGVVVSATTARELFGDADPLGRVVFAARDGVDSTVALTVTGVAADAPAASSIPFDLVAPFALTLDRYGETMQASWTNIFVQTYVLLHPGADAGAFAAGLPAMVRRVGGEDYREGAYTLHAQPLPRVHLDTAVSDGLVPTGDPRYAAILSGIALFVLLIACINFVTLSVAQSSRRAREVGLRKAIGAQRGQLARQFWGEALIMTGLAVGLAFVLAALALPAFRALTGRPLHLAFDGGTTLGGLVAVVVVGLVAGAYPAFALARLAPIEVLRNRLQLGGDRGLLRRALVVVQFTFTIFLIAGTFVLSKQLRYLQSQDLGYDREHVVVIPTDLNYADAQPVIDRFRQVLAGQPAVAAVSNAGYVFDQPWIAADFHAPDGALRSYRLDYGAADFPQTMGLELVAGRYLRPDEPADSTAILVNEALVRAYGLTEPLGARLPGEGFEDHEIVGVLRDFHYASLRESIGPAVYAIDADRALSGAENVNVEASPQRKIVVRLRPGDVQAALALLERTWRDAAPGRPFNYRFLDEAVAEQYRQEARMGLVAGTAAGLSIVIACLGLFGLAALSVERRRKEIGVRKVLGASAYRVVVLLSKDFAALVAVAFVLAVPAAYLAAQQWLDGFAYRTPLGPGLFLLAGAAALAVALLTVSTQALRAASADPVKALRAE